LFCRLIRLKEAWLGGITLLESMDDVELRWRREKIKKHKA